MPEKAIRKAFQQCEIYISPALLQEYRDTPIELEQEGKIDRAQFKALVSGIAAVVSKAKVIEPSHKIQICRDPEDDMLLECCLEAGADILLTGDKDLLEVQNLTFHLKILTPRKFLGDD